MVSLPEGLRPRAGEDEIICMLGTVPVPLEVRVVGAVVVAVVAIVR